MAELWDLYDRDRAPLGRTVERGQPLPQGAYHLAVAIAVLNPRGELLLTLRSPEKDRYPGWWEIPGGCAKAGEDSFTAACRELFEETGIRAEPGQLTLLASELLPTSHLDTFAVTKDTAASEVVLLPGETVDARWMPLEEWLPRAGKAPYLTPSWHGGADGPLFTRLGQYCRETALQI